MMSKKILYFLCFLTGSVLAITVFYIEWRILSEMVHFEEPIYHLPNLGITLKGAKAGLAHIVNFALGLIAVIIAGYFYGKFRQ